MKTLTKLTDKKLMSLKTDNKLKSAVIDIIMDRTESERIHFITDTLKHGCVSGMVGELIYYSDTCKFYNEHKEDIFDLADESGICNSAVELFASLNGAKDVHSVDEEENLRAWFGFEEMLRRIADQLEIEY